MKFTDVLVGGKRRVNVEVHPAADAFPLMEGAEFDAFVEDIRKNGFRHPVVLAADHDVLLDGRNRLRAAKQLGVDPPIERLNTKGVDVLAYIVSTNIQRRHLTESQRAYVAATLATIEHGANDRAPTGKFAGRSVGAAPTQAQAAKLMQVSERSVRDAHRVITRGDDELGAAVKGGKIKVSAAAKVAELGKAEQRQLVAKVTKGGGEVKPGKVVALAKQQAKRDTVERINSGQVRPMGIGPFGLIVVDYPWPYGNSDAHEGSRGHLDYPTMSLPDIARHARVDVAKAALPDCILALWVTNAFVHVIGGVLDSAGFEHRSMVTWDKGRAGVGTWPRGQTEHLVLASRGKPVHTLNAITTLHREPAREHSRKPDGLMDLLAKHCAGPHLEMFAREERPGWVVWGAEVGKFRAAAPVPDDADDDALTAWGPAPSAPAAPPTAAVEPAELDALDELLDQPWTCPEPECGHVNTFRILDGVVEVCGNCEVPRPRPAPAPTAAPAERPRLLPTERHGSPGKPAKTAKPAKPATVAKHEASFQAAKSKRRPLSVPPPPAATVDAPYLKPKDMILVRWQPGTTKRARFVRYNRKGDLVVNVQAVDRKGKYLKQFGSDRTFSIADYAGRAPL